MRADQVYWDLLHAEYSIGEFGDHVYMLEGVDTKIYNAHLVGAYHRILSAQEHLILEKDEKIKIKIDFKKWILDTYGKQ
jgi:hypothetical protein